MVNGKWCNPSAVSRTFSADLSFYISLYHVAFIFFFFDLSYSVFLDALFFWILVRLVLSVLFPASPGGLSYDRCTYLNSELSTPSRVEQLHPLLCPFVSCDSQAWMVAFIPAMWKALVPVWNASVIASHGPPPPSLLECCIWLQFVPFPLIGVPCTSSLPFPLSFSTACPFIWTFFFCWKKNNTHKIKTTYRFCIIMEYTHAFKSSIMWFLLICFYCLPLLNCSMIWHCFLEMIWKLKWWWSKCNYQNVWFLFIFCYAPYCLL